MMAVDYGDWRLIAESDFQRLTALADEWDRESGPGYRHPHAIQLRDALPPRDHVVSDTEDCWCEPTIVKVRNQ